MSRAALIVATVAAIVALRAWHAEWAAAMGAPRIVGFVARITCFAAGVVLVWRWSSEWPKPNLRSAFQASTLFFVALWVLPYSPATAAAWFGLCASAWVLGALVLRGMGDVVLTNVCLTVVGLELALRIAAAVSSSPLLAIAEDRGAVQQLERQYREPGTLHFGRPLNAWGDHDDPPQRRRSGECLVACVGDSFSLGVVPHAEHYTTVAEKQLGDCGVYNMGTVAIGPREYLHLVRTRVPLLDPTLTVVALYVGNDVFDAHMPALSRPGAARPLLDRERFASFVVGRRMLRVAREWWRLGRAPGNAEASEPSGASPEAFAAIQNVIAESTLATDAWMYEHFFELLDEIVRAREKVAFLVIPAELQVDDPLWRSVVARFPSKRLDRDQPQRKIRAWMSERKIPFLDLLPAMRAVPAEPDGSRRLYRLRDTHLNARGNRVAGEALAAFLREQLRR